MCPHPFVRTTVIKFVPRYYLVNKLDIPIVIKEASFMQQKLVMNGEEVGFNLAGQEPNIQVRLVNIYQEFQKKPKPVRMLSHQIDSLPFENPEIEQRNTI